MRIHEQFDMLYEAIQSIAEAKFMKTDSWKKSLGSWIEDISTYEDEIEVRFQYTYSNCGCGMCNDMKKGSEWIKIPLDEIFDELGSDANKVRENW